ncbi:MAG: hypothetical protein Q8L49_08870 [Burkholderiaceae bacterium]|nr:hypothetical protein [Burkholderiaceae bacterium]
MNETNNPASASDVPWPTSDNRVRAPDTSMLPRSEKATPAAVGLLGSEKAAPAAVGLLKSAAQGAHATIDRFADSAEPAVRQLGESVAAAGETLHAKTDQLRDTGDAWVESVRTTVRGNPLTSVAAAFALGAVIARITR